MQKMASGSPTGTATPAVVQLATRGLSSACFWNLLPDTDTHVSDRSVAHTWRCRALRRAPAAEGRARISSTASWRTAISAMLLRGLHSHLRSRRLPPAHRNPVSHGMCATLVTADADASEGSWHAETVQHDSHQQLDWQVTIRCAQVPQGSEDRLAGQGTVTTNTSAKQG